jgi:hypothetical protein
VTFATLAKGISDRIIGLIAYFRGTGWEGCGQAELVDGAKLGRPLECTPWRGSVFSTKSLAAQCVCVLLEAVKIIRDPNSLAVVAARGASCGHGARPVTRRRKPVGPGSAYLSKLRSDLWVPK